MSYPAAALQKGIYDILTGNSGLQTAFGGTVRVYDNVPPGASFPYLTIGDAQILDDGNSCDDDYFEAYVDVHVWSRSATVGQVEAKTLAGLARDAMASISVTGWTLPVIEFRSVNHFMDPDGVTARARLNYRFLLQPSS